MIIDDYAAVYRLWQNTPGMGLNTTDDSEEGIAAYLKRNPNTCFVAEKSGEIVGAILSGHDGRRGYIYHVAVEPMIQHGGIGTSLVDRAMDALKNEGIPALLQAIDYLEIKDMISVESKKVYSEK